MNNGNTAAREARLAFRVGPGGYRCSCCAPPRGSAHLARWSRAAKRRDRRAATAEASRDAYADALAAADARADAQFVAYATARADALAPWVEDRAVALSSYEEARAAYCDARDAYDANVPATVAVYDDARAAHDEAEDWLVVTHYALANARAEWDARD